MSTNKLRKLPLTSPNKIGLGSPVYGQNNLITTTSRTMMLAQASVNVPHSWSLSSGKSMEEDINLPPRSTRRELVGLQPTTPAAQYWAARAVTAEALLSARESHHTEIRSLSLLEDMKRKREISTLTKEHNERHAGLERLAITLVGLLSSLVALITYLATQHSHQSSARQPSSHFTIPILSPFTSVVENEVSAVGSKIITVVILFVTGLAYLVLRPRIARAFG